jgi:diguanylate cyclase (GGDEF)-like protein
MAVQSHEPGSQDDRLAELDKIIGGRTITPSFQPIVDLHSGEVLGFEALSRGPAGSPLASAAMLFDTATRAGSGKLWELELACRERILEQIPEEGPGGFLFMNVDPFVLLDARFSADVTRARLEGSRLRPEQIVFEITERRAISDFEQFRAAAEHYHRLGFQIAIDDAGAGYSGLQTLVRTRPQFVKLDQELIRNIHVHGLKQNLLRFFVNFARSSGFQLIAEGIETPEELEAVMRLGIHYGQGYFIARPRRTPKPPEPARRSMMHDISRRVTRMTMRSVRTAPVGQLTQPAVAAAADATVEVLRDLFAKHADVLSVVVVSEGKSVGLLPRAVVQRELAGHEGAGQTARELMARSPLRVEYDTPIEVVNRRAMARPSLQVYDDIIVEMDGAMQGLVTVRDLLQATTDLELDSARHAHPLTNLPGSVVIEREINRAMEEEKHWSVTYVDLNNFKIFNDVYGFQQGDEVIRFTAELVQTVFGPPRLEEAFVGHMQAGNFVVIAATRRVDAACRMLCRRMDREALRFYGESDRSRGYMRIITRSKQVREVPLLSVSLSVLDNETHEFADHRELERAAERLRRRTKVEAMNMRNSVVRRLSTESVDGPLLASAEDGSLTRSGFDLDLVLGDLDTMETADETLAGTDKG